MKQSRWAWVLLSCVLAWTLALPSVLLGQERGPSDFADTAVTINIALSFALIYAEPSAGADISAALSGGVTVTLTGEAETVNEIVWWEVESPSGQLGWLPERQDNLPTMLLDADTPLSLSGETPLTQPTRTPSRTTNPSVISEAGETQIVVIDLLLVYAEPDTEADILEAVSRDVELRILDAEAEPGWAQVESPSGLVGWVETTVDGLPTLVSAAVARGELAVGSEGVVNSAGLVLLYGEADDKSQVVEALSGGVALQIIGGPEVVGAVNWWQVRSPSSIEGWLPETVDGDVVLLSPSALAVLTPTPAPTLPPTLVAQATLAPTPTPLNCPGAPPPRLVVGATGFVTPGLSNRVRESPGVSFRQVDELDAGERFTVIGGPVCADNFRWWQIDHEGITGWTADGTGNTYWLDVIALPPTAASAASLTNTIIPGTVGVGAEVQVQSLEPAFPLRVSPSIRAAIVVNLPRSERATVLAGPENVSESTDRGVAADFSWWQIRTADGQEGWMPETAYGEPILVLYNANVPVVSVSCTLSTIRDVNIRSGPGTQYEQIASRAGEGQILAAEGQFGDINVPEAHWWRLAEGFWVRNDQVREQPRETCALLPVVPAR